MSENEFEQLAQTGAEENNFSETPDNELVASGSAGTTYDWNQAPDGVKAPPRENLDGKETTLNAADIILPPTDRPWSKTRDGSKDVKYCTFVLKYDINGQQEYCSGVRVFNRDGKYSHPTLTRDRKNQASELLGLYADHKGKDINEVSLKEFMAFLNSKPKIRIKSQAVTNPSSGEVIHKNLIGAFV